MKKNFKYFGLVWLVGFVLFNAITFLIPNKVFGITRFDKPVFWVAYALVALSFVAQLVTAYTFLKEDSKDKMFLHIPLLQTGYTALIVSLVVGAVFMIVPVLPTWLGAIVCLLVAGYFIIACVKAGATSDIVAEIDEKIKTKTAFIRMATVDVENILARATTEEIKTETKKVYEALKYSDPMSNAALEEIEQEVGGYIKQLKQAVMENDGAKVVSVVTELTLLIQERNSKCKLLK